MSTFNDPCNRCIRHPHHVIVGVCPSCLRERLAVLAEPNGDSARNSTSMLHESPYAVPSRRRTPRAPVDSSRVGVVDCEKEEVKTLFVKKLHKSDASVPASPDRYQISISSPSRSSHQRNKSLPNRRSNASESDRASKLETDVAPRKKRTSLWSLFQHTEEGRETRSKVKTGQPNSSIQGADVVGRSNSVTGTRESQERSRQDEASSIMRSPGLSAARRREATESYARMKNQDFLASRSAGEAFISLDVEHNDSTSWISSLFLRKKRRSKSVFVGKSGIADTGLIDSARCSVDGARPSLDGATPGRPNLKQYRLMKQEGRKQGLWDHSEADDAGRYSDCDKDGALFSDLSSVFPGRKSMISSVTARNSISVEVSKDSHSAHASPGRIVYEKVFGNESRAEERNGDHRGRKAQELIINPSVQATSGLGTQAESEDDRHFSRSRSWGRAWSKTLSPLWGLKQHSRKDQPCVEDIISAQRTTATPDDNRQQPAQHASSLSKDYSAFSFYFSPLRRSRRRAEDPAGGNLPHQASSYTTDAGFWSSNSTPLRSSAKGKR